LLRPEGFRSFAELLRPANVGVDYTSDVEPAPSAGPSTEASDEPFVLDELVRDVRSFRARLDDLLERSVETLLERIARDVFAREYAVAPPDVRRIVERTLADFCESQPVRIRIHPSDAAHLHNACVAVQPDAGLYRGEVVFELDNGALASTLETRLNDALIEALTSIT